MPRASETSSADGRLAFGTNHCLCTGCGYYFGGVSGFERHRVNLECIDPATAGLVLNSRGYWTRPAPSIAVHCGVVETADFGTQPYTPLAGGDT